MSCVKQAFSLTPATNHCPQQRGKRLPSPGLPPPRPLAGRGHVPLFVLQNYLTAGDIGLDYRIPVHGTVKNCFGKLVHKFTLHDPDFVFFCLWGVCLFIGWSNILLGWLGDRNIYTHICYILFTQKMERETSFWSACNILLFAVINIYVYRYIRVFDIM